MGAEGMTVDSLGNLVAMERFPGSDDLDSIVVTNSLRSCVLY